MGGASAAACGQCGKPAVAEINSVQLCVDCYSKLVNANHKVSVARDLELRWQATMYNLASDQMDQIAGFPPMGPHIQIPPRAGPVTYNNIKINNSVVGAINTGNVQTLDVNLTNLQNAGNQEAKDALQALAQAVLNDERLDLTQKNELIEQIAFLTAQAAAPPQERKPGLLKATFTAVGTAASTITSVAGAWEVAAPILKGLFGL